MYRYIYISFSNIRADIIRTPVPSDVCGASVRTIHDLVTMSYVTERPEPEESKKTRAQCFSL